MIHYVSYNGKLIDSSTPVLFHENRSFRYGDGFFETIRAANGKIYWPEKHYNRILETCKLLNLNFAWQFSLEDFKGHILQLYLKNHPEGQPARIRMSFFRNEGGFYKPSDNTASFLVESSPLENAGFSLNKKGLMVGVFHELKKNLDYLSGIKSSSALFYIMAASYCSRNDLDDCILLNQEGNVAEALSSNIFIVKDEELVTPALDQGCVNGIMRSVILDIASETGIRAWEAILTTKDIEQADEFFITNSIQGIKWVAGFRQKRFFNKLAPELVKKLNKKVFEMME